MFQIFEPLYWLAIIVFDTLDFMVSHFLPRQHKASQYDGASESDALDGDTILTLCRTPIAVSSYPVFQICKDTVAKCVPVSEGENVWMHEISCMQYVHENTFIPVPRFRRVVKSEQYNFILIEHIRGEQLTQRWRFLSFWQKLRVMFTLRRYFRELRALECKSGIPGPPGDQPLPCRGLQLNFDDAVFADTNALRAALVEAHGSSTQSLVPSQRLVFTHNKLCTQNVLVSCEGRVWIMDWTWAGWLPPSFEQISMWDLAPVHHDFFLWRCMIPFVLGPAFEDRYIWEEATDKTE